MQEKPALNFNRKVYFSKFPCSMKSSLKKCNPHFRMGIILMQFVAGSQTGALAVDILKRKDKAFKSFKTCSVFKVY